MDIISLFGLWTIFCLLIYVAKIDFDISLLICAFMAPVTYFGTEFNLGYIFFFCLIIPFLFNRRFFRRENLGLFIILCILLASEISLSYTENANLILNGFKFIQLVIILYVLFNISSAPIRNAFTKNNIKKFIIIFFIVNVSYGIILFLFFGAYQFGMIRFSGIFFDANYFSLYCIICLYLSFYYDLNIRYKIISFIFICITLSSTGIIFSILFIILNARIFSMIKKPISAFIIVFISAFSYVFIMKYLNEITSSTISSEYLIYKIASLYHRLNAQFIAVDLLNINNSWMTGFGSGRTLELVGLALHNFYLQSFFAHGALYLVTLIIAFIYAYHKSLTIIGNNKYYSSVYFSFLFIGFLLDPFFLLYFHIIILFSINKVGGYIENIPNNGNLR